MTRRKVRLQTNPPKYKAEIHIPLLHKLFSEGKAIANFCVEAGIVRATFHTWVEKYSEFGEAYELATLRAQIYWEEYAIRTSSIPGVFNYSWWAALMRNRFGYTEHRKLRIKNIDKTSSFTDKYNIVLGEVAQGNLTGHEIKQLSESLVNGAKLAEVTSMAEDIKDLKALISERQTDNNQVDYKIAESYDIASPTVTTQ